METVYAPGTVKKTIESLGLDPKHESVDQINMVCPYHSERIPSFTINTVSGLYHCFAPACGKSGTLVQLVMDIGKMNEFEALRFLYNGVQNPQDALVDALKDLLRVDDEFHVFDPLVIQRLSDGLSTVAIEYMESRSINLDTLKQFNVGYSDKKNMVTIPIYSHTNIPVGIVGRCIDKKRFEYSQKTPISKVWFNLNQAKRKSSTAIIVEASMDALRIHQAGYPNVISILGGQVSGYKMELLNRYFDKIIIMTDSDGIKKYDNCNAKSCINGCIGHDAGRDAGMSIASRFQREVYWAIYDTDTIYPQNAKDPGEISDQEIAQMINNSISHYEYLQYFVG